MAYGIAALFGYLLGSIPFGLVLCKIFGYGDVRNIGSGGIGATNVLRTGNKMLAFATLLLDSGKGAISVLIVPLFISLFVYIPDPSHYTTCADVETGERISCPDSAQGSQQFILAMIAGFFALIGHCYPVWLKFKGGKGVATASGTLLVLHPLLGLSACGIWLLVALTSRISSLSALVTAIVVPVLAWLLTQNTTLVIFCVAMTVLVFAKHHENIRRLLKGEEPKIGQKGNKKNSQPKTGENQ